MNLLNLTPAQFCDATQACGEGYEFAVQYTSMADVWDNCPRPNWLLWIADKIGQRPDDRTMRLFAIWCARSTPLGDARTTGDLLTDPRSLAALEVAERYANGMATPEELAAARGAAQAVEWAVAAATEAAAVEAAWAAEAAAWDAAEAAWVAAWGTAARKAALVAARKAQADQFRRMVPNPFRAKEGQL